MRILLVSPYHGGSHAAWADGLQRHSEYDFSLLTLADRFWKWRMHGGAITLARRFVADESLAPDVVMATDMLDLTTFAALTRRKLGATPLVLYMHENQLTYPLPADGTAGPMRRQLGERDQHYAFVNYASMMTADLVLFNSQYHRDSFFEELPRFLKHFPENNELGTVDILRKKSQVLAVGVDFGRFETGDLEIKSVSHSPVSNLPPPLIVWNQRWEYDKNPEAFFAALYAMEAEGIPFRLALCGQQFGKRPSIFNEAIQRLGARVLHVGYAEPEEYKRLLWEAAVTVSTAHHEFFGISVLEAIYCQTFPILPQRLSYPELIPEAFHLRCLYQNQGGLIERLRWALTHPVEAKEAADKLQTAVSLFNWTNIAPRYDQIISEFQN